MLSPLSDVLANITLAHCDAVGRGHPLHQLSVEINTQFNHTTTNRLNRTHRPNYLLSGLLECAHCAGPYAIMSKNRYGCTNRQKDLPIPHLDDGICPNSKTISRAELETRVLDAIPARLLSVGSTASLQDEINKELTATAKAGERDQEKLERFPFMLDRIRMM